MLSLLPASTHCATHDCSICASMAGPLEFGRLVIDRATVTVTWDGKFVALRPQQFRVLEVLARHPRLVLSRDQLLDLVGIEDVDVRSIDAAVARLRTALAGAGAPKETIRTALGFGYAFEPRWTD